MPPWAKLSPRSRPGRVGCAATRLHVVPTRWTKNERRHVWSFDSVFRIAREGDDHDRQKADRKGVMDRSSPRLGASHASATPMNEQTYHPQTREPDRFNRGSSEPIDFPSWVPQVTGPSSGYFTSLGLRLDLQNNLEGILYQTIYHRVGCFLCVFFILQSHR